MTKLFPIKAIMLLLLFAGAAFSTKAQLLTEDFNYTAGTLLTANGWTAHSGAGTNAITVTAPGLVYAGHPGSGIGNAVSMTTSGEDVNKTFTAITSGTAYTSFLVTVSAATATGDYFIGLLQNNTTFPVRVYAKTSGAGFVFGLGKGAGTPVYEATVRSFGTTYLVVTNYIYNAGVQDDALNLWVNPTLGAAEPAATIANVTAANADATTIIASYLRQGGATSASTQRVDAILVGTTWASVTPGAVISTVSVASGANAAEPSGNGSFTINFSPSTSGSTDVNFAYTGSASFGTDYTVSYSTGSVNSITSTGTLTVPAGTSGVTVTITPNDDLTVEGTEGITLTLSAPSGGYTLGTAGASINLVDNDVPPTVSVAAGTNAAEPSSNGSFTINFSAATTGSTEIGYAYTGTAGFGTDYTVSYSAGTPSSVTAAGTLTIPAGVSAITVTISPVNDADVEVPETIILTISSPTGGYVLGTPAANITITSDDIPPPTPISLTGIPYTQDFNALANTGTTNLIPIQGWLLNETGSSARVNGQYAADNGSSTTADIYSYGTTSTTERAFGTLLSGTLTPSIGAFFVNNTGTTVNRLKITYTGEQWRLGTINRTDQLNFQYSLNATSLTTGTWTDVDPLDFISPFTTTAGARDGNAAANKKLRVFTITGLSIPNGSIFYIRWTDPDVSGAEDGLSVDDFTIETDPIDITGPQILTLTPANGALNVQTTFTAGIEFDENIQKGTGNIYVKRFSDNGIVQTINAGSSAVTVSGNTASFDVTGLLFSTAYYITIDAGAFKDVLNNGFAGISSSAAWSFTTVAPPPPGIVGNLYNFDVCTTPLTNGFTQFSAVGPQKWDCTTFGIDPSHSPTLSAPNGLQINGFSGTNIINEDWLISPVFDLTSTTYPLLSFWSRTRFNGQPLQLKVSTDYPGAGNPNNYTWTDLNGRFPAQTTDVWTLSENINLSGYKSTHTYFAFVYHSSEDDGARWTLDDILVSNSLVPPPPSLTVSTTDIQFPFVSAGSTTDKSFTFIGNDLVNEVTVQATGAFLLSKDGLSFSPSLTFSVAEANNLTKTVYVRFSPPVNNQDFAGSIHFATGALAADVNLKGTSIDPATTLEVVNWNMEWFGSTDPSLGPTNDALQEENVKTILQSIGADLYAVVEVVDEARLANIVSQMPGYAYVICNYGSHTNPFAPNPSPLSQAQKEAFIYKTSVFSNISTAPMLTAGINSAADITNPAYNYWSSGRFPFLLNADVTLNCVTKNVKFVLCHAKANTSPTAASYDRRKRGSDTLHYTLNQLYPNDNIVILGDINDDLDVSITEGFTVTSWNAFTEDGTNYTSITLPLSLAGKKSTVSYNDVIDHVIASSEMTTYYLPGSANILNDVANLVNNYATTTSDHYPVFSRYRFANTIAPTVASCTETVSFCQVSSNSYSIPPFTASDDCEETLTYSYTITGATTRNGNSGDASGTFNPGISTIDWTATDSWGNQVTCQTTVTINTNPTVNIPDAFALPTGVLPNTVYIGYAPASSLVLNAVVNGGSPGYGYSWTNGSTTSSTMVSPLITTLYTVTVTDQNNCQAQASKTVTVMDIRGGKNLNKTIICHKPGSQDNTITIDPSDVVNHLAHGDMLGACGIQSSNMITSSPNEYPSMNQLSLRALPNPTSNQFSLVAGGDLAEGAIQLKITDQLGRIIEVKQNLVPGQPVKLGDSYQPGVYFAEMRQGTERVMLKLVKL